MSVGRSSHMYLSYDVWVARHKPNLSLDIQTQHNLNQLNLTPLNLTKHNLTLANLTQPNLT